MIQFVSKGRFFNVESCRQEGRSFSVEDYDEFDSQYCRFLSSFWVPESKAEEFHGRFIENLRGHLESEQGWDLDRTNIQEIVIRIDDALRMAVGGLILGYAPVLPRSSGKLHAIASRILKVSGLGYLAYGGIGMLTEESSQTQPSHSAQRAQEISKLLNRYDDYEKYLIGPTANDFPVQQIMELLEQSLKEALQQTVAPACYEDQ